MALQVSLGPHLKGLAPPMPDVNHGPTLLHGCLSRFCSDPPKPKPGILEEFEAFVRKEVTVYNPLSVTHNLDFMAWLLRTPYPEKRKMELMLLWDSVHRSITKRDYVNKGHGKRETYLKFKAARGINSRSDVFKCWSGPFFKAIEEVVFADPYFIKHVPVCQRPAYLMERLGSSSGPFFETDYSAFEKHFTPEFMNVCEMVLYQHMLQNFPEVFNVIREALTGRNRCEYKKFTLTVPGKRMSGDMCTSLGNGFTNLMLAKFVAHRKGLNITGVVEGDDGLFACDGELTSEDFLDIGFHIKILRHADILSSSFCGLVMSGDLITMTDPRKVLLNFGWSHSPLMVGGDRVRCGLLRAKALSLAYEHPRCPILSSLARRTLFLTEGFVPRFEVNWYESFLAREVETFKEQTAVLLALGPSDISRSDFEKNYGISIDQQKIVEEYIMRWNGGPLDHPLLLGLFDETFEDCRVYYDTCTF